MKRLSILAVFILSAVVSFAQGTATLRVSLTTNRMLAVSVDDRYYERRGTSLTIGDLPAGRHYLKVYNYRITRNGNGRANLVYSGYVNLSPNTFNNCVIDPFQRMMRMRTRPEGGRDTRTDDRNRDYIDNDRLEDRRDRDDVYENWNDNRTDRRDDNVRQNYDRRDRDNYEYNSPDPNAVSDQEITDLGNRVKDRITDTDKLKLMQSVLNGRTYYTNQLRSMFNWLNFESTKLDLAKWAYVQTIDKENYWKLEDVFSFSSSKDELSEYIQSNK